MNLQEVTAVLNEQLAEGRKYLRDLDDFYYKDFQSWKEDIQKDIEKLLSGGSSGSIVIPRTPAVSRSRLRRRLSAIQETQNPNDAAGAHKRPSKNTSFKHRKNSSKVSKKYHSKRPGLNFEVSEDETETEETEELKLDDVDNGISVAEFSQDSLNVLPVLKEISTTCSNVADVNGEENSVSNRKRRTKSSVIEDNLKEKFKTSILKGKLTQETSNLRNDETNQRTTRNTGTLRKNTEVRTTRNTGNLRNDTEVRTTRNTHNVRDEADERTPNIVNLRNDETEVRTTRNTGILRKNTEVRTTRNTGNLRNDTEMRTAQNTHLRNEAEERTLNIVNLRSDDTEVRTTQNTGNLMNEVKERATRNKSILKGKRTTRNTSNLRNAAEVRTTRNTNNLRNETEERTTRNTSNLRDKAEERATRNASILKEVPRTRNTSNLRNEAEERLTQNSHDLSSDVYIRTTQNTSMANNEVKVTQNPRTSKNEEITSQNTNILENDTEKRSVSTEENMDVQTLLRENCCKELRISLKRIRKKAGQSDTAEKIGKTSLEKTCNQMHEERSLEKLSEKGEQVVLEGNVIAASRKRSLSLGEENCERKKIHLGGNENMNESADSIKDPVNMSVLESPCELQDRFSPRTSRHKNMGGYTEVKSFSEITSNLEGDKTSCNDIFASSDEGDDQENAIDVPMEGNTDSGNGNSVESDVESSEYYSVGSKAEAGGESIQEMKRTENHRSSWNKASTSKKLQPETSLRGKIAVVLSPTKKSTAVIPDRKISRKGGASPVLFSAYANEPVKNRVAAYEALSPLTEEAEIIHTVKRVTRTKTRAMAAAAAKAAAVNTSITQKTTLISGQKPSSSQVQARASLVRAKKRLAAAAKKNDAKENSIIYSAKNTSGKIYYGTPLLGSKILADVNGLSTSQLNTSRKTPLTASKIATVTSTSVTQLGKSGMRPGVILTNIETFIKRPVKVVQDLELKKLEEQKKREEKEREAQIRKEELLKKKTEENKKKNEIKLRVLQKREAQEKEKQESQLRIGREKDEKWNIIQQEREAKQKGNVLKKKLETERKAAEARRKLEDAEAARLAKLKMEEQQRKKDLEEIEKERLRLIAEEKETALLREKTEQKSKEQAKAARQKAEMQKNATSANKPLLNGTKQLDVTFSKPLDSTFTVSVATSTGKDTKNINNAYNLEDILSEDSDNDSDDLPKKTAPWATRSKLLWCSRLELPLLKAARKDMCMSKNIDISQIFPNKRALKRTSSAIWNTPPRYSCLPKY